jgi:hypothetical protein
MFYELLGSFIRPFLARMPANGLTREGLASDLERLAAFLRGGA